MEFLQFVFFKLFLPRACKLIVCTLRHPVVDLLRPCRDVGLFGIDDGRILDVGQGFQRSAALALGLERQTQGCFLLTQQARLQACFRQLHEERLQRCGLIHQHGFSNFHIAMVNGLGLLAQGIQQGGRVKLRQQVFTLTVGNHPETGHLRRDDQLGIVKCRGFIRLADKAWHLLAGQGCSLGLVFRCGWLCFAVAHG